MYFQINKIILIIITITFFSVQMLFASTPYKLHIQSIIANSSYKEYIAENAIDNDITTSWASGKRGAYLILYFGKPVDITKIKIRWIKRKKQKNRSFIFSINVLKNKINWRNIIDRKKTIINNSSEYYNFAIKDIQYLKLITHGNNENSWTHISEIEVYGLKGTKYIPPPRRKLEISPGVKCVKVAKKTLFSGYGYYGISPESPDGKNIAYIQFKKNPQKLGSWCNISLIVVDCNLKKYRHIVDITDVRTHNTACPVWVDNMLIAFQSGKRSCYIVDINTKKIKWGPLDGTLNHNTFKGKVLISSDYLENNLGKKRGLYEFDCYTGQKRLIITHDELIQKNRNNLKDPDEKIGQWIIQHAQYTPDGKVVAIKFLNYRANEEPLITFKRDGSDMIFFGRQPMHCQWFDNNTLFGHDDRVNDGSENNYNLKRWDRKGKMIEVLAGRGCHPAMSPDKKWFATESWYKSNPVALYLYKRGEIKPRAVLMNTWLSNPIWKLQAHVNPSFAQDGKRVYFFNPVSEKCCQAYYADISQYIGDN